jgi:hypothetical protein
MSAVGLSAVWLSAVWLSAIWLSAVWLSAIWLSAAKLGPESNRVLHEDLNFGMTSHSLLLRYKFGCVALPNLDVKNCFPL